jgi:hypothetical protein
MGSCSFLQCKASAQDRRPPPWRKASCTGKPSARFPTVKGGLVPIAFGADSVASALHLRQGRDPSADAARLPRPPRGLDPNRNFLLCWKEELSTLLERGTFYFALTRRSAANERRATRKLATGRENAFS